MVGYVRKALRLISGDLKYIELTLLFIGMSGGHPIFSLFPIPAKSNPMKSI
ncbi:hypothetical protein LEP1GSC036_3600 [Leptospira weilii str. 2006001853]|uniref:Uncharacterized protein n=3 Tax=Leptospira weilii TaxID=28184 RepID=A0A828Z7W0_9LEPT|nr:hypothetical protein LEP1GSC036_3600 [Leptospira weilii str. 2006001853]EMM73261.1 hypothetical protein LEP1GSC038_1538 [Leptospira weilii str. 2006001855]EMN45487.1 hypothetical protein LEP1GSC086_3904 [Leptospira weilii str. LNT 1234]EMN90475.1 hypothetical protein LEP1GSC108_3006 [Leptospira weilii str. UI 13098]